MNTCLNHLHGKKKIQYIWDYYKLPIIIGLIFLYIISYTVHGHFSKKEALLYTGLVNVSASEQLTDELSYGFLDFLDANSSKKVLKLYTGLYLTDNPDNPNHEYTYASRIKTVASIDDEKLDILLMNKEAFDAFSQNGYLYNMEELLRDTAPEAMAEWEPYLVTNTVILEDNADDILLDGSLPYQAVTDEFPMGLLISEKGLFRRAGFEDDVYLGVVKNSPRMDMAIEYIKYLYSPSKHTPGAPRQTGRAYLFSANMTLHRFL